ncbi:MAG TPA: protein kinase [Polyangiaceae bacterium]
MDDPTVVDRNVDRAKAAEPLLFGKRYRPVALLGTGGMGSVYLARDEELDEMVAVKVLRPELVGDASMVERFRDEVRLARRVSSPFVARTHDLGEHAGRWFVTMQYVEGETLSARLRREGRLPVRDAVAVARDVCRGLGAVHEAGIVHRDLKPGNVLLASDGRAVLTDFGIAVRAGHGAEHTDGSGTPTYAAPEQLAGGALDARTDVFAFGVVLFEMITGKKPFDGPRTGLELAPDPRRLVTDVPDALAAIVARAMALDPDDRWASCDALATALGGVRAAATRETGSKLSRFAREIGAGAARRVSLAVETSGLSEELAAAARVDLASRLDARGKVRVVSDDAEAAVGGRIAAHGGDCSFELAMTSAQDGYLVWSDAFGGPLAELPQLVERAAHAIELALVPTSVQRREELPFPSTEVAELFLEARTAYRGFWGSQVAKSAELFDRARALAPDHPRVLAWCAAAHTRLRFYEAAPPEHDLGRDLALRAVALAPESADSRVALASANMQRMAVVEAVPHFVEALRIAPGLVEQRSHFARVVNECGAIGPARVLAESALELDPTFTEPMEVLLRQHALRGRLDLAATELARARGRELFLRVTFARYCLWNRDRAWFEKVCGSFDSSHLDAHPKLLFESARGLIRGEPVDIGRVLGMAVGAPRRVALAHQIMAEMYAFVGDEGRALDSIESALALGLFDVQWMDTCPLFDPLRGTLRFESARRIVHDRAMAVLAEVERRLA